MEPKTLEENFFDAVCHNKVDKVKALKEKGVDIHTGNDWALNYTRFFGGRRMRQLLGIPEWSCP